MEQLVLILQGHSMRDILVKITDNEALELVIPIDRVITIDENGYVYLYDQCIQITEDMIEKEI